MKSDILLNGRISVVILDLYPNKLMRATEIWQNRKRIEGDKRPKLFTNLSCGATYAALRSALIHGFVEEVHELDGHRYRLTQKGRTTAVQIAKEFEAAAQKVLTAGSDGLVPVG